MNALSRNSSQSTCTSSLDQGYGVEFAVSGFWGDPYSGPILLLDCTLSIVLRGFSQCTVLAGLKFSLYIVGHLLLEELRIFLRLSLSTQVVCQTVSPKVGIGV